MINNYKNNLKKYGSKLYYLHMNKIKTIMFLHASQLSYGSFVTQDH